MIDKELIRERYSTMTNEELIKLARYQDLDLTNDALIILQEELTKRNLGISILDGIDSNIDNTEKRRLVAAKENIKQEYIHSVWDYIFDSKDKGFSDSEIKEGLTKKGLENNEADNMLQILEHKSKQMKQLSNEQMLIGGVICLIGLIVTYWTFSTASNSGDTFVVAWGAIIFGAIRFFKGHSKREKYNRILLNIEGERSESENENISDN